MAILNGTSTPYGKSVSLLMQTSNPPTYANLENEMMKVTRQVDSFHAMHTFYL